MTTDVVYARQRRYTPAVHLASPMGDWACCDRKEVRMTRIPEAVTCRQCRQSYGWKRAIAAAVLLLASGFALGRVTAPAPAVVEPVMLEPAPAVAPLFPEAVV